MDYEDIQRLLSQSSRIELRPLPVLSNTPLHVWVVARYEGKWVLTKHKQRGLEFPGGKVEPGSTRIAAAIREVYEETGGIVKTLRYLGQYRVLEEGTRSLKICYFADIERFDAHPAVEETDGPC